MIQVGDLHVSLQERTVFRDGVRLELNNRAFAILQALIAERGTLVTKDALLDFVWPASIVEENNLHVHIVSLRRALGDARDLIRTVSGRGYILLPQPSKTPTQRAVYSLGLPQVDILFGRLSAVERLMTVFQSSQIITLTGPGGIGKTSLAVELCGHTGVLFRCIRFISLAALTTDRQVREAVFSIFADIINGGAMTIDELAKHLRNAKCLLIFDNCEHLIDSVAEIVQKLCEGNDGVRVVSTSREALRITGEAVFPVSSLCVPSIAEDPAQIWHCDSVKLFLHRLNRIAAEYRVDEQAISTIGELCRRLDGIPLAIELAAARAATLGLEVIRTNLNDRFAILTGGARDVLPRHQTLRAVFDWSYRLLSRAEQLLFRQTSIFVDGFSFDAIAALMVHVGIEAGETADGLAELVAKSLVHKDLKHGNRFRLLESARAFSKALLENEGEANAAANAHAVYFRNYFSTGPYSAAFVEIGEAQNVISVELGNMREAMAWAFHTSDTEQLAINLASTTIPMLYELPLYEECRYWGDVAMKTIRHIDTPCSAPKRLAILTVYASALVYTDGPQTSVRTAWMDVLSQAERMDDDGAKLRAMWGLWNQRQYAGEFNEALNCAKQFQAVAKQIGTPLQVALSRRIIGITLHYLGRHAEARDELLGALAAPEMKVIRWSTTGVRTDQIAATQATLARIQWFLGDKKGSVEASELAEESARLGGHALTLAYILIEVSIPIAILRRSETLLLAAVASLQKECRSTGMLAWLKCCSAFEWIANSFGHSLSTDQLNEMESAIDRVQESAYLVQLPLILCEFARALNIAGNRDRALSVIDDAIDYCDRVGSLWYIDALKGEREHISSSQNVSKRVMKVHVGISG